MQRGHLLIVSVLCCLCAVGPLVVCVLMDEWYVVMSMTNSFKLGLTNMCIVPIQASDGATSSASASSVTPAAKAVCGPIDYALMAGFAANAANVTASTGYEGRSSFSCSVQPDADAIQQRFLTIQGLVVAALAIGAVQGLLGIAVGAVRVYHWAPRLVLAVLAVASAGAGIAACVLYPLTIELWLFCGQRYCSAVGSPYTDCTNYLGYGYALLCCGAGLLALNVVVTLVVTIRGWDQEVRYWEAVEAQRLAEKERQKIVIMDDPWGAVSRGVEVADCTTPPDAEVQSPARRRYPNEPPLPLELQGGDWEYDPDTGYFWSEESALYFEPETQQFYDPQSDAWFNPETELWYKPLAPTEGDVLRPREPSPAAVSPSNGAGHFGPPPKAIPSHRVGSDKETVPFA